MRAVPFSLLLLDVLNIVDLVDALGGSARIGYFSSNHRSGARKIIGVGTYIPESKPLTSERAPYSHSHTQKQRSNSDCINRQTDFI
jgi:hypothetical protein